MKVKTNHPSSKVPMPPRSKTKKVSTVVKNTVTTRKVQRPRRRITSERVVKPKPSLWTSSMPHVTKPNPALPELATVMVAVEVDVAVAVEEDVAVAVVVTEVVKAVVVAEVVVVAVEDVVKVVDVAAMAVDVDVALVVVVVAEVVVVPQSSTTTTFQACKLLVC